MSVVTQLASLSKKSKTWVETNRRNQEAITYDRNGQRKTWKTYNYLSGALFDSVIYKLIDGDKVSIYEKVENSDKIGSVTIVVPSTGSPRPSDPRYDYKLKYKYDNNGNVSEEAWYQNNGSLWMRYTYNVSNTEIQELVYAEDGSLNQKVVHILDKDGNEIQTNYFDVESDKIDEKVIYEYLDFDAKKNWTKRRVLAGDRAEKFVMKPREANFRVITYF